MAKKALNENQRKCRTNSIVENTIDENSNSIVESLDEHCVQRTQKRKRKDGDTIVKKRKKSRKGKDNVGLVDHTAQLPEPVIYHILSLLPSAKVAARTSILSKRWKQMWVSYSSLEYDEHKFLKQAWRKNIMFRDFVNRSFEDNSGIQKLVLIISSYTEELDSWIGIAIQNKITELDLRVDYSLPRAVFASETITTLRLRGCDWEASCVIKLPNLKRLYLKQLVLDEEKIENFFVSCPAIEDLRLINCDGLENLRTSSNKLKRVGVCECESLLKIELEAPNLHTFCYSAMKSEPMPCNFNSEDCKSLKLLSLDDPAMTESMFQYHLFNFPLLEKLSLTRCDLLRKIEISSHRLEALALRGCAELHTVDFDTPNLVSFEYKGEHTPFSSLNPFGLEEAKISCQKIVWGYPMRRRNFIQRIEDFLKKFYPHEGFKLIVGLTKVCLPEVLIPFDFL